MITNAVEQTASMGGTNDESRHAIPNKRNNELPSVSVIIPTYNEADNIELVIERVRIALEDYTSEIIVVDDDSPDNTWRIASLLYDDVDNVHIHRRTTDKGLAKSIAYGFDKCSNEFCAVLDADLQHPPEDLPDLLRHTTDDTDMVIGSRYTDFGRIKGWTSWRKLVSLGATKLAKALLPSVNHVDDPLSGFFIVRHDIINVDSMSPGGYKILLELLARCEYERVDEVPYLFTEREHGESNLTASEYVAFVQHLMSLRELK
jgi:dolichol-phosphate mannosyltransferase